MDIEELVVQAFKAENPLLWVRQNYEQLDDTFFDLLDAWRQMALQRQDDARAQNLAEIAQLITQAFEMLSNPHVGHFLLKGLEEVKTHAELQEWLRQATPLITQDFFVALGEWADESTRNSDTAIYIYETLLDEIGFNDVRADWQEPERSIVWGAAWFMNRHHHFIESVDLFNDGHPLDYQKLHALLNLTIFSHSRNDMISTALAMCNLFLAACPRVVDFPSMDSREDEMRFETLVAGANLIRARWKSGIDGLAHIRRLLGEAQAIYERLKRKPMASEPRLEIERDAIALTEIAGILALDDHKYEDAVRLLRQAIEEREALAAQARSEGLGKGTVSGIERAKATLLSPLAMAVLRLWRLDDACGHYAQLVEHQRQLVRESAELPELMRQMAKESRHLAEALRWQARAEFLRTEFARAEALLDEAAQVEQELISV